MADIARVESGSDLKKFIDFPHDLYGGDPNYVPELYLGQKLLFDRKKNPFFRHSKADLYLAVSGGKVAGRIALIRNNNHLATHRDGTGFFGFFEVVEDYEIARLLLDTAVDWIKQEGLTSIVGPANFTTNDSCGFLIHGFDRPPVVMMPYNKRYYAPFMERYGFEKKMDLYSYDFPALEMPEEMCRFSEKIEEKLRGQNIVIRPIDFGNLKNEILAIREVYNEANRDNWGFVPLTVDEFLHMADDIKLVTNSDPEYILVAEHRGRIVAYLVTVPDINIAFKKLPRGRLLPFGLFKLLYYKKRPSRVRIIILGILEEYRFSGIDTCFFAKNCSNLRKKGIVSAEAAYVLETNDASNRLLKRGNGTIRKKYRIFAKALS